MLYFLQVLRLNIIFHFKCCIFGKKAMVSAKTILCSLTVVYLLKIVGSSYHYYSHRNISNFISRSGILLNRYVCWIIRGPNTVCNHGRPCFDVHRFVRCYENFRQVCLTNNLNITQKLLLLFSYHLVPKAVLSNSHYYH